MKTKKQSVPIERATPVKFTACPNEKLQVPSWHIHRILERVLPREILICLDDIKRVILARKFPRKGEFIQPLVDRQASGSMSIIVPIHDAPLVSQRCLSSLEKYAPESEIIIVDDGSKLTETGEVIRFFTSRNSWKVIHNQQAIGHSGACWAGTKLATRLYICLLNSDTVVTPWCWRQVKEAFEQGDDIGVAGPSSSNTGNPQSVQIAEFLSFHLNDHQICALAERLLHTVPLIQDLPWISGNALFIRRALWDELKGFDPNLPDYGNEIELCGRVSRRGFRSVWVRNSYIHHFGRQSYKKVIGDQGILQRIRAAEIYATQKASHYSGKRRTL